MQQHRDIFLRSISSQSRQASMLEYHHSMKRWKVGRDECYTQDVRKAASAIQNPLVVGELVSIWVSVSTFVCYIGVTVDFENGREME